MRDEIEKRDKLAKQFKCRVTVSTISDTSMISTIAGLEIISIVTITTGVGIPVGIALASTGLIFGLGSAVIHKTQKIFESKAKKHDKIKTLAESKLDSISNLVSRQLKMPTFLISHISIVS